MTRKAIAVVLCIILICYITAVTLICLLYKSIRQLDEEGLDLIARDILRDMHEQYANGVRFRDNPLNACDRNYTCIIDDNYGGREFSFLFAAKTVEERAPKGVEIYGFCASGCALFADLARPHVCISRHTYMEFHKATDETEPYDSREIKLWVYAHGGFPSNASHELLDMYWNDEKKFWPLCENDR